MTAPMGRCVPASAAAARSFKLFSETNKVERRRLPTVRCAAVVAHRLCVCLRYRRVAPEEPVHEPVRIAAHLGPPGVSSAVPRPPDENRPVPGERALALDQPEGRLVLVAGDRVDLYAVDDYSPSGHLLVGDARVLIPGDRSVTVAVPVDRVADVAAARRWGEIALALAPTAP